MIEKFTLTKYNVFFCWSINKYAPAQLLKHTMVVVVLAYIEVLFFFLSCIQFDRWWNWLPLDTLSMNKTWLSWFGDFRGKQELIDRYIFSQGSVNFFYISIFFWIWIIIFYCYCWFFLFFLILCISMDPLVNESSEHGLQHFFLFFLTSHSIPSITLHLVMFVRLISSVLNI